MEPAVVRIETDRGMGSGFFVGQDLVVTNYHVIEDAEHATAKVGKETYRVLGFLAIERGKDLALLRVDRPQGSPVLRIASQVPQKLEEVYALGSPLGLQATVTHGEVSAVRTCREIRQESLLSFPPEFDDELTLIQTTAPISPGNSGGPLVNAFGEVVGVNAGSISQRVGAQNLNFAISCVDVQGVVTGGKSNALRPLASLPGQPVSRKSSQTTQSLSINPSDLQVRLPDGEMFSLKSLLPSEKDVHEKFFRPIENPNTNITEYKLYIPHIGYVWTGILFRRTAPVLFGFPNTYAFIWTEKPEIREGDPLIGILGGRHDQAMSIVGEQSVPLRGTSLVPIGVLCYDGGKLHGVVNLDLHEKGCYLGVWDRGKPSLKHSQMPKDFYPKGMFVLYKGGGEWTLLKRAKGTEGQLFICSANHIRHSFDTLEKAIADPEGKAQLDAFQQAEATIRAMSEAIANTFQRKAKALQQALIAEHALRSREENILRGNEQRARYAAAVEAGFRDAARRSGW